MSRSIVAQDFDRLNPADSILVSANDALGWPTLRLRSELVLEPFVSLEGKLREGAGFRKLGYDWISFLM